jgi:hypothetical protein
MSYTITAAVNKHLANAPSNWRVLHAPHTLTLMHTAESGMLLIHMVGASSQFELASRLEDLIHLLPWVREIELVLVGFKWVHQYPPTTQQSAAAAANQHGTADTATSQQPTAQQQQSAAKEPVEQTEPGEPIADPGDEVEAEAIELLDTAAADSVLASTGEI